MVGNDAAKGNAKDGAPGRGGERGGQALATKPYARGGERRKEREEECAAGYSPTFTAPAQPVYSGGSGGGPSSAGTGGGEYCGTIVLLPSTPS